MVFAALAAEGVALCQNTPRHPLRRGKSVGSKPPSFDIFCERPGLSATFAHANPVWDWDPPARAKARR